MMNKKEEIEIKFLSPRDAVRKRAGMYVGGVENANVLIREILDNCGDELSAGYGSDILVSNNFNDGWIFVADNGRGIPITYSKDRPTETQAKLAISELHSGSKFESSDYARTGLNGVGSSAVNFLSESYILMSKITEDNYDKSIPPVRELWKSCGPRSKKDLFYILVFEKGYLKYEGAGKLRDLEKNIFRDSYISIPSGLSTIVLFKPDPEVFTSTKADIPIKNLQYFLLIQEKLYGRKLNVEVDGVSIKNDFKPYKFEVIDTIIPKDTSANKQVSLYLTFEADPDLKSSEEGSVNGLVCENGMHLNLARNLFKAALKDYFKINHDYLLNGYKFKVVLIANEVTFSSQTKENLKSINKVTQKDFVDVVKSIEKVFKKNPDYWGDHVRKLNYLADSMRELGAAEKAQRIIDAASSTNQLYRNKHNLVDGFVDATSTDRWNCELMLCFTGDTKVLTDNGQIKFTDLVERVNKGEKIYTLSCTRGGEAISSKIIAARKIKEVINLCRVVLDNGEEIRCTPDHRIMLRSGDYKEAKYLKLGDSLMPCCIGSTTINVVSVEVFEVDNEPVYCLEVDSEEHNFPLAAGVFVKNCEGLSPAGSLISARKAEQVKKIGCLPLRGKVLDTSGVSASKMLDNKEMYTVFSIIGLGLDCNSVVKDAKTLEEAYEIIKRKSRYGKIILCQDSDEDGLAIRRGLLYTFAKFARFLIDLGCVYYISSPIFEQFGKYYYPEDPRIPGTQFCVGMDPEKKYRRFKGLGSLNKDDVFKSFYDESTRRLIRVTPDNIDIAMELAENISKRKDLLYNKGILTNPYNFTDL